MGPNVEAERTATETGSQEAERATGFIPPRSSGRCWRSWARPLRELFALPTGETAFVAGAVISRQRPPTAKGFCFLVVEDETGRLPTPLPPHLYERFKRVLCESVLVAEGLSKAPPEEKRGGKTGVYRSVLIERMWALETLCQSAKPLHGAQGLPRQSPRVAPTPERSAHESATA